MDRAPQGGINMPRNGVKNLSRWSRQLVTACTLGSVIAPSGWSGPEGKRRQGVHGRCAVRGAVDGRFCRACLGASWVGAVVSGSGVIANAMGGVLALLLLGYLFYALVRPEKF